MSPVCTVRYRYACGHGSQARIRNLTTNTLHVETVMSTDQARRLLDLPTDLFANVPMRATGGAFRALAETCRATSGMALQLI
jgi:hypothetical protein